MYVNYESLISHVNPMYLSKNDNIINNTDNYHMYIKSEKGEKIKIKIPNNCLALQIGETLQILSGGYLKARPHYLRLCQKPQISMEQFSVYVDCFPEQPLEFPQQFFLESPQLVTSSAPQLLFLEYRHNILLL